MRVLGAVLAGGEASRFGSDKALAKIGGETLLDRAVAVLKDQCNAVCVVGRRSAPVQTVADWPRPGLGPLGGISGALRHARDLGLPYVLTCAVDIPKLPVDLVRQLTPAPACVAAQPVVGLWRVADIAVLDALLASEQQHSLIAFANACGARRVELSRKLGNINTREDLESYEGEGNGASAKPFAK
ncbi:molybdenum cofactor guanylyltransferase [Erythrobacter litoralis]|nr:molybdenum cofactor guanylyltransferase [Erythrobacter litoralis]